MGSVSSAQASLLSTCSVLTPRFDSLVNDQVLDRLPVREIGTQCQKRAVITAIDMPAVSFIASGGSLNATPVGWQDPASDYVPKRVGSALEVTGIIKDVFDSEQSVADLQASFLATVIKQQVGKDMWALSPGADAPTGMVAFSAANPNGIIDAGATAVSLDLLGNLRALLSPWSMSSPLAYVMHSKTFAALESSVRGLGFQIPYYRSEKTGRVAPFVGSFEVLLCDWISLTETVAPATTSVYLIRIGKGIDDPEGIEGVSLVVPEGRRDIQVTPFEPEGPGANDLWKAQVYWDVAIDGGSRGAAIARARNVLSPPPPPPPPPP